MKIKLTPQKTTSLFVLLLCIYSNASKAQTYVTIPDVNFVSWLQTNMSAAMNGNQMDITNPLVTTNTHSINVSVKNISDLTGIQYFTSLSYLNCSGNNLTSLPTLPTSLTNLSCLNNQLTLLPTLPNSIDTLNCGSNFLVNLPTLPNSLIFLDCSDNPLASLPTIPNSLTWFSCWNTQLPNFPSLPNSLKVFICSYNPIKSLPTFPGSLILLDCRSNYHLTSLPVLPNLLQTLYCHQDSLTNLPSLPNSLTTLDCSSNFLATLPALPNSLSFLDCSYNLIACFSSFSNSITSIDISNNSFNCLPNYISSMDAATLAYPLCASGNSNGCPVAGIEQIKVIDIVSLYPNPASNTISLNIEETFNYRNSTITIQNTLGQTIKKLSFTKNIDVSDLSEGCYFLQVTLSTGEVYKAKFIKQ